MSSQSSKLTAAYRTPGYMTNTKRKFTDGTSNIDTPSRGSLSSSKKKRLLNAQTRDDSDSDDDSDEEDFTPMSVSQLNKHSKGSTASMTKDINIDKKIMDAKLERMAMKSRAAQHKDNRNHPLLEQQNYRSTGNTINNQKNDGGARYVKVMWRLPQTKKHKTWDGDGWLVLSAMGNRLLDDPHKQVLARDFKIKPNFEPGETFFVGTKEIEIERDSTETEYRTGRVEISHNTPARVAPVHRQIQQSEPNRQFTTPSKLPIRGQKVLKVTPKSQELDVTTPITSVSAKSFYAKLPTEERIAKVKPSGLFNSEVGESSKPLHDPAKKGSILMRRPDKAHQREYNKQGFPIGDVVVNPVIAQILRPHQIEGVRFLYERVMGMRDKDDESKKGDPQDEEPSCGAILADEMGLGKTLQTITVVDMLLHQNCYVNPARRAPAIDRALIVCPLSLVKNWAKEFRKWLGKDNGKIQCIDAKNKIGNTLQGNFQVLIIGYEKLLTSHKQVANVQPKFGLLVCDEAHRLKNQAGKTSKMFANLTIDRRILLTGTPIQNNLMEYHAMVDLVAPGLMGQLKTFKQVFEDPILKSRLPHCSDEDRQLGKDRSEMLQTITKGILLRRTAELLADYLPAKHEMVIFCSPSAMQVKLYELLINSDRVHDIITGTALHSFALTAIGLLSKLCNSPELLISGLASDGVTEATTTKALLKGLRPHLPTQVMNLAELSGKLLCVTKMLIMIKQQTDDKVVLISNYTSTLDILEAICRKNRFSFSRLDGKTKEDDRNRNMAMFNQSDQSSQFIFLLSKKAGGVGVNLIGANRLILFDSDWNPSADRQAMARIHRDGQKKPCYIYRMLIPGTMDEKIYQRQISKLSLSDSLIDQGGKSGKSAESFTPDELRSIFQLHLDTRCLSHDQMRCPCEGNGIVGAGKGDEGEQAEEDDSDKDDKLPPPPPPKRFMTASQMLASQQVESKKESAANLSALLRWAHHDCTKESSAPTQDSIINGLVERQHRKGIYTEKDQDTDEFDITKTKAGSILYVYAESFDKKKVQLSQSPLVSDIENGEEEEEDEEDNDDDD